MKVDYCVLIGVGGTGSNLAESLAQLLSFHPDGCKKLILIDGDRFEQKNLERQKFDPSFIDKHKVDAIKSRIHCMEEIITIAEFINKETFTDLVLNGIPQIKRKNGLFITAVDNFATRRDIIEAIDDFKLPNYVLIDPGNGLKDGEVKCHVRKSGRDVTIHPFIRYPDMKEPEDKIPGGCAEQTPSFPQLLVTNFSAALNCLLITQAILDDKPFPEVINFDCEKMMSSPLESCLTIEQHKELQSA